MRRLSASLFLCAAALSAAPANDEQTIRAMYDRYAQAVKVRDLKTILAFYAPEIVAFDAYPPRQYTGIAAYRKDYEDFFAAFPGPITSKVGDLHVTASGSMAYVYGVDNWMVTDKDGKAFTLAFRFTDVLRKMNGKWLIVHEHLSFPVDPETGKADFLSKP